MKTFNPLFLLLSLSVLVWFGGCPGPEEPVDTDAVHDISDHEGDDPGECEDEADNDFNGDFDCDDDGCKGSPVCKENGQNDGSGDGATADSGNNDGSGEGTMADAGQADGGGDGAMTDAGQADGSGDGMATDAGSADAFGHKQLGGVAPVLASMIQQAHGYKYHWAVSDYLQRAARHIASKTDVEQAYAVGKAAVEFALAGKNAIMPIIVREQDSPYQ